MGAECSRNESINPYGIQYPSGRPFYPPINYPLPENHPRLIWHN